MVADTTKDERKGGGCVEDEWMDSRWSLAMVRYFRVSGSTRGASVIAWETITFSGCSLLLVSVMVIGSSPTGMLRVRGGAVESKLSSRTTSRPPSNEARKKKQLQAQLQGSSTAT